ncbi:MAG: ABC transporter ATP-binding protein [Clostridiales bacterium]
MKLEANHIFCGYGSQKIVQNASFSLESGQVLCLLGPNGVGKTTLFKALLGFLPITSGQLLLDGQSLRRFNRKQFAEIIGYVPQVHEPPFPFSVLDVVVMGSIGRLKAFESPSKERYRQAVNILESLNVGYLHDRIYTQISGGERQMVLIARALMQQPRFLVMDEPTSNLDFGNQMRVLAQIEGLAQQGVGIVMTSHFPDHAFLCCTKVALMCRDQPFRMGSAEEIITEDSLKQAYGVQVRIATVPDEEYGPLKTCLPILQGGRKERLTREAV